MIRATGVTVPKRLEAVSIEVGRGEVCALVGPNGAGKSTLLSVLAGLVRASGGIVTLGEREVAAWVPLALAKRRAVVTQGAPAPFPLTIHEVVALGRLPHGDERVADGVVHRCLDAVGLTGMADRGFATLSGGERQRVQIARAFAQVDGVAGAVLLLDEPTAAADLAWQERLMAELRRRADEGATVVVVVHDLNLASRWADSVVVLHRGRVIGQGTPSEVLTGPRLAEAWGIAFHHARIAGHGVVIPTLEPT